MVSDRDRHELFVALEDKLGPGPADTMMDLLPPVGWADVARKADVEDLRREMKVEFASVRAELASVRAVFRTDMASLKSQLIAANVATALGVGGLVLAAAKFV